ncbi:Molybdopterin cofactor biosynthesis C domain-containing protein, partial [Phyllosticta citriasiana]|uniref:Molybdopterin cofactor biosynthesis C domain-containing protein n=1 Tax=Phyllosticta citriasiana TaxID=595635 RepID=UPI0030FD55BB
MNFVRHLGDSSRASRGIINKRDQDDIGRRGFHTVSSARQQHLNQDGSAASGQKTTAEADQADKKNEQPENGKLTHVNNAGEAHMVNISDKADTRRVAFATSTVRFSTPNVVHLIRRNRMNKGDVLSTARIAGIMAAKQTPNLVPLCHNIPRMNTGNRQASDIPLDYGEFPNGAVFITARCESTTATGVEMEALVAANAAALTVYDMSKAVDKHMVLGNSRVVLKAGGKSGTW